ncbi:MAG: energy transducer TonB, partial [Gemmatimonadetes bacterium]|nr:energy transducer TonB [Gemmatimonadota bacterium]
MILHWMLYCSAVALLLGISAASLEKVVRQRGWQVRWLWGGALAGSAVLPMLAFLVDARREAVALSGGAGAAAAGGSVEAAWLVDPFASVPEPSFDVGPLLLALWAALSAATLLSLGFSFLTLERRRRGWHQRSIDGQEVWVAPDTGPAVVGFVRSHIVLPEWVLERSETERAMVMAHESEHLRAGDPRLILGALLLAAALPWNVPLWWQWRRLREAVEVDCDLRVIARGLDPRAYGRLLVEVTERGTARRLAVAALSESHSSLERRIKLMFTPQPRRWWLRAVGAAALALACIAVACTADIPSGPGRGPAVNASSPAREGSQDFAYEVAVLDRAPQLSNQGEIAGIMERLYPSLLRSAGIGGTVVLQFVIKPDGTTDPGTIKVVESAREELAAASVRS